MCLLEGQKGRDLWVRGEGAAPWPWDGTNKKSSTPAGGETEDGTRAGQRTNTRTTRFMGRAREAGPLHG